MKILMIDDSIAFDGSSPRLRPLGGGQKAVAELARAFAAQGHDVHVFNRATIALTLEGVHWEGWNAPRPPSCDVVIAVNDPQLLDQVPQARLRLLWSFTPGAALLPWRDWLRDKGVLTILANGTHAQGWDGADFSTLRLIAPAAADVYHDTAPAPLSAPPTAIVTTHPDHGLDFVLNLWCDRILPACPDARLVVVSALLNRGSMGLPVSDANRFRLRWIESLPSVSLTAPLADEGMSSLYQQARAHLYPGHPDDVMCWTLLESQTAGLPAVARNQGGVRARILDGQTGHIVPDGEAFANLACHLLRHDESVLSMRADAIRHQRHRRWADVATGFSALFPPESAP